MNTLTKKAILYRWIIILIAIGAFCAGQTTYAAEFLEHVVEDTTPQLGGDLDGQSLYDLLNMVDGTFSGLGTFGNLYVTSDANVAGNLTVGGKINDSNTTDWDMAYTNSVDTWTYPLLFSGNVADVNDATTSSKGVAQFSPYHFTTDSGEVFIKTKYTIGDNVLHNNSASNSTLEYVYVKVKETKINIGIGSNTTLRIKHNYEIINPGESEIGCTRVYRNGSPVGSENCNDEGGLGLHIDTISGWSDGDLLQVYAHGSGQTYAEEIEVSNLQICGTISLVAEDGDFTSQDP